MGEDVDLDTPIEHLRELCAANKIETKPEWGTGKLIAELYDEIGESSLVNPTFVVDYPGRGRARLPSAMTMSRASRTASSS